MDRNEMGYSMSNDIQQQRPEPRFKVNQIVMTPHKFTPKYPLSIVAVEWSEFFSGWRYEVSGNDVYVESDLRPLSIDEIGSDELSKLGADLEGSNSRRADMMRERDKALLKLAASRGLCGRMLPHLTTAVAHVHDLRIILDECREMGMTIHMCGVTYKDSEARSVIAEAEAEMKGGE